MDLPLCKRHFVFNAILLLVTAFFSTHSVYTVAHADNHETPAEPTASSTISDDEIDGFLFRVNEDIKSKVVALDGAAVEHIPVPILFGISLGDFTDTWGEARSQNRVHTGTDITAREGTLIVSPTDAVVTKTGYDSKGGNFVITANPGGEQFYYAHLDAPAETIQAGSVLAPGDLIGYVGNTGNARGKSPHLHLGIYYKGLARNPFPKIVKEFSTEEKMGALEKIISESMVDFGKSGSGIRFLQQFLIDANSGAHSRKLSGTGITGYFGTLTKNALAEYQEAAGIRPASGYFGPVTKTEIFATFMPEKFSGQVAGVKIESVPETKISYPLPKISNDLELGSAGSEVRMLQNFLIDAAAGPDAETLANAGITGYFGTLTKNALAEYQEAAGIRPASGYFGPLTRAHFQYIDGS